MATYGIAECMLRPYSKVVITASTFQQASSLVEEKMERELFAKERMSPVLYYLYKEGLITVNRKDQQIEVNFLFNNSVMYVVPCQESARRLRATILMFEECRLMTKTKIDSIFENMLQPRTAMYLSIPKYNKEEYLEDVKSIYITSNRTKNEWFYTLFKNTFTGYFNDFMVKNRVFACDIFTGIKYGLKSKSWFFSKKRTMNELDFRMEVMNETLGEGENAYFTLELMNRIQTIKYAFIPPKPEEWKRVPTQCRKKQLNEHRIIFVDFAFSDKNSKNRDNDNTVIGCYYAYPKGESWARGVEYLETHSGGDSFTSQRRIRELYWFYEADYIVLDLRSGGERDYNQLGTIYEHPTIGADRWNSHGFTVCDDMSLNVVKKSKIEELAQRTIDPKPIKCIIPIQGNEALNSEMWIDLLAVIKSQELRLLVDDLRINQILEKDKNYITSTSKEKAEIKLPYTQTFCLIQEAVNLKRDMKTPLIRLSEPSTGYKDRIVALSYGNYISSKIINRYEKTALENQNINWDDIQ